eukprot:TRINITY_DN20046_c0_g1_i1.p1 TRINITY_DN20046_c0_g1~~TRINITY_DN20046_c0_g1_i1.p1  ORF type:complete len:510 (+),score=55.11 TRINITY_DN20046_c0_g1_i1:52-1530(+)
MLTTTRLSTCCKLLLQLLLVRSAYSEADPRSQLARPQVAIIGSGVGGASTAHFLQNLTQNSIDVHVYEKSDRVGGRIYSFQYEGKTLEIGGSIIHKKNKYLLQLAKEMGLETPGVGDADGDSLMAIFDGNQFVFKESKYSIVNYFNLIWRYGFAALIFRPVEYKALNRFLEFYDMQANGTSFESPVDMLQAVELYNFTQHSFRDIYNEYMHNPKYKAKAFLEEILGAVNRINYNQNNTLNALAGLISNLASSASELVYIKGGNQQLPEKLLESSKLKLNSQVNKIAQKEDGKFEIQIAGQEEVEGPFDVVVIAVPLELANIQISLQEGKKLPTIPFSDFRSCISTYVKGNLKASAFGLEGDVHYGDIFATEKADTFYQSISFKTKTTDNSSLYKIFSTEPLTKEQITFLFENGKVIKSEDWLAYPHFNPPEKYAPFVLSPGLIYNCAMDHAADAMEVSAVSAMNSALLTAKYLGYEKILKKQQQESQQQIEL